MALAKKCEICGKWFEHFSLNLYGGINAIGYLEKDRFGAGVITSRSYNTCPECFNEIKDFLDAMFLRKSSQSEALKGASVDVNAQIEEHEYEEYNKI